jgi:hypothetical protein
LINRVHSTQTGVGFVGKQGVFNEGVPVVYDSIVILVKKERAREREKEKGGGGGGDTIGTLNLRLLKNTSSKLCNLCQLKSFPM